MNGTVNIIRSGRKRALAGACFSLLCASLLAACSETDRRESKNTGNATEANVLVTVPESTPHTEKVPNSQPGSSTVTLPDGTRLEVYGDSGSFSAVLRRGNSTDPLFSAQAQVPAAIGEGRLGGYELIGREAPGQGGLSDYRLQYQKQDLFGSEGRFAKVETGDIMDDVPLPGCETRRTEGFTGGANCCFGYYLVTECLGAETAVFIRPFAGTMDENVTRLEDGPAAFALDDPTFQYYQPQAGGDTPSLSRADSPHLTRYLVYNKGIWRMDQPGELPQTYTNLAVRTDADKEMNPVAKAIAVAYYRAMVGDGEDTVRDYLKDRLPADWSAYADDMAASIVEASNSFNPLRKGE